MPRERKKAQTNNVLLRVPRSSCRSAFTVLLASPSCSLNLLSCRRPTGRGQTTDREGTDDRQGGGRRRRVAPMWGHDTTVQMQEVATGRLTGYSRDPDLLAAGPIPAVRGGPHLDDAVLSDGQQKLHRRFICGQHLHVPLTACPVENLRREQTFTFPIAWFYFFS